MLSGFIICHNEAHQIRRALSSLSFCDEIIVVDSGSTDGTLDIVREFTDKIYHRDWTGFLDQKSFALNLCSNKWVLNIDSDEEVSKELKEEILAKVLEDDEQISGYEINRVVFHLGKWFRKGGWYPEYRLRLFRKEAATWGGEDPHEKVLVAGKTEKLIGELLHYSFKDLRDHVQRLEKYAYTSATNSFIKGKRSSLFSSILRAKARFFKIYLLKKGFLEGKEGFVIAALESFYVFLKYLYLWDLGREKTKRSSS